MMKYMFKKAISLVAAAILSMVATTGWSQTIDIPLDGWSISNNSTFQVNTWSSEGNSDGSDMTTPFLENWVYNDGGVSRLAEATWSYTVQGLTPNATYVMSALVRAYNENSTQVPGNVRIYAGSAQSSLLSSVGTQIYVGGNTGIYGMLTVLATADASGRLTIGLRSADKACNWLAMKNVTLSPIASSAFVRVTGMSELTVGAKYLIVHQSAEDATTGYALDGSVNSIAKQSVSISNYLISTNENYAFTLSKNGSSYDFSNVNNRHVCPKDDGLQLDRNAQTLAIVESGEGLGFYISRTGSGNAKYVIYKDNNFHGSQNKSLGLLYLYKQVSLSFPQSTYTANLGEGFAAPALTKSPASVGVTYSSSNPSVASVNSSTGAVTLRKEGQTMITVTYQATKGMLTASYVLNVKATATTTFRLVTDVSQIVGGRKYLIVLEEAGYALDGSSTSTTAYARKAVTIANNEIEASDKIAFAIDKSGDYYNIKQVGGGRYLSFYGGQLFSNTPKDIRISSFWGHYMNLFSVEDQNYCLNYANGNFALKQYFPDENVRLSLYREVVEAADPNLTFAFANGVSEVQIGGTLSTKVTRLGQGAVTYSSSNPAIATVNDKGEISGVSAGTATITATVAEDLSNGYKSATKTLTVTVNKITPTLAASFSSRTIAKGDQVTLELTTNSTGTKRFESLNPAIATVDNYGVIRGVSDGQATIRYWVDGNDTYLPTAVASVSVTVASKAKLNPQVTVTPQSLSLAVWEVKNLVVNLGEYDGECEASLPGTNGEVISLGTPTQEGNVLTYPITAEAVGQTTIKLHLLDTDEYNEMTIEVPVTVLSVYRYTLNVVDAPSRGVAIEIFGTTYTGSTTFNSSHHPIKASDVNVRPLASYTSQVSVVNDNEIIVTYSLRMPEMGTFMRLKSYSGNLYATLSADGEALTVGKASVDNIIYYDQQSRFLFYKNGQFVKATNLMASVGDAGQASSFTFVHGNPASEYSECYRIKTSSSDYLCGSSDGTTVGGSDEKNDYAYWYVETLERLPVEVISAGYGYATLYSPVALDVPGGVSAYYVSDRRTTQASGNSNVEYQLVLRQLVSLIPAATPTILVGIPGTTYDFPLKYANQEERPSDLSNMVGHFEAELTAKLQGSGTVYALQPAADRETAGFYPWHKEITSPFKCFFLDPNPNSNVSGYRFVFAEDGNSTGLNESMIESVEDMAIYNLHGQRVADSLENLPKGIYIVRGKKMIVK